MFSAVSSRKKLVCSDESSVPLKCNRPANDVTDRLRVDGTRAVASGAMNGNARL
ncbi:hypothetical protein COSO111634_12935 [Corallococcus soli]